MSKNVKLNVNARRYTVLIDENIYRAAKAIAADPNKKHGKLKWYQYLNWLLARETGLPFPAYLKHPSTKDE